MAKPANTAANEPKKTPKFRVSLSIWEERIKLATIPKTHNAGTTTNNAKPLAERRIASPGP